MGVIPCVAVDGLFQLQGGDTAAGSDLGDRGSDDSGSDSDASMDGTADKDKRIEYGTGNGNDNGNGSGKEGYVPVATIVICSHSCRCALAQFLLHCVFVCQPLDCLRCGQCGVGGTTIVTVGCRSGGHGAAYRVRVDGPALHWRAPRTAAGSTALAPATAAAVDATAVCRAPYRPAQSCRNVGQRASSRQPSHAPRERVSGCSRCWLGDQRPADP